MQLEIGRISELYWGGFNTLEWLGCAALVLLTMVLTAMTLKRTLNLSVAVKITRKDGPKTPPIPRGCEKLLITDDDPTTRAALQAVLTGLGYQVVCMESGEKTITYLEHNGADLMLLDLFMKGGLDGIETYRRVRSLRPLQKAIIISGYADPDHVAALRNLGVENYLVKPTPIPLLAHAIRTELDRP